MEPSEAVEWTDSAQEERVRRWRMVLGGARTEGNSLGLSPQDQAIDRALGALYEPGSGEDRRGGLGTSSPQVARWLDDIRQYFPTPVVQVMQRDAINRLGLKRMLLEPELLNSVTPSVELVGQLMSLRGAIPDRANESARQLIRQVVEDLEKRLASPLRQAITGALTRAARNRRPKHNEIDWNLTVKANLRHYQPKYRTVIPERLVGMGRRSGALRDVIVCIDQSGSMASSVVYAGIFSAVMASVKTMNTRVIAFDTACVDLSEHLNDPVDLLFGIQLGGGTDIHQALAYAASCVRNPTSTILVLISDLFDGADIERTLQVAAGLVASGVQVITLLALSDNGAPAYDHEVAKAMADLGSPVFACTPEAFPEMMAAAIQGKDVALWAAEAGLAG